MKNRKFILAVIVTILFIGVIMKTIFPTDLIGDAILGSAAIISVLILIKDGIEEIKDVINNKD